jgi:hypothetical protein
MANTPVTDECLVCAGLGEWSGNRLVRPFVPPVDLGHDGEAHRIYNVLWYGNRVRSAVELAGMRDSELLRLRGLGPRMFKRIREKIPAPAGAAPAPGCGPTPNGLICACGRDAGHNAESSDG